MRKVFFAATILGLLASCGGDEPVQYRNEAKIDPTSTKGSIVGRVETFDRQPIAGATIEVPVGSDVRTTTTDAEGRFAMANLPGGSDLFVRIHAEGYVSAQTQAYIPNQAGEVPMNGGISVVGPVILLPADGRVEFELYGTDGKLYVPARGTCAVETAFLDQNLMAAGTVMVEASFEDGRMVCDGLPDLRILALVDAEISFTFPPIDADGDGHWDYEGADGSVDAESIFTGVSSPVRWDLVPRYNAERELEILASNVGTFFPAYISPLPSDEAIELHFNQPIVLHRVELTDVFGDEDPGFETSVEGAVLKILPGSGAWPEGQLFRAVVFVGPLNAPSEIFQESSLVFVAADSEPTLTATFEDSLLDDGQLNPGETLVIKSSQPFFARAATFPQIRYQIDFDLDSSGIIGDSVGEYGFDSTFLVLTTRASHGTFANEFGMTPPVSLPEGVEIVLRMDTAHHYGTGASPLFKEEIRVKVKIADP